MGIKHFFSKLTPWKSNVRIGFPTGSKCRCCGASVCLSRCNEYLQNPFIYEIDCNSCLTKIEAGDYMLLDDSYWPINHVLKTINERGDQILVDFVYSNEVKVKASNLVLKQRKSLYEISRVYGVSIKTLFSWLQLHGNPTAKDLSKLKTEFLRMKFQLKDLRIENEPET